MASVYFWPLLLPVWTISIRIWSSLRIRDTKGIFHAKMSTVKDRDSMELTETEDIKKRWREYTEELYKKNLNDPAKYEGVITHLESDILEYEVKWAFK